MKPTFLCGPQGTFTTTEQTPARQRKLTLGCALTTLIALGALGCSVRAAGEAKSAGDGAGTSSSSSTSDAHASAKAEGSSKSSAKVEGSSKSSAKADGSSKSRSSAKLEGSSKSRSSSSIKGSGDAHASLKADGSGKAHSSADAKGSGDASAKLKSPARAEGKVQGSGSNGVRVKVSSKVSVDSKRVVFQSKPRVSAVARAKAAPVFVGVRANVHGTGSLHASGSGKLKGSIAGKDKDAKDKPTAEKPGKEPVTKPGKEPVTKPGKEPVTKPGKEPVTKPGKEPVTKPGKEPVTKPGKEPVTKPGKKPVEETPKQPAPQPLPTPIEPPSEPPENVFGYDAPVRGCFEGLVYFIPENSKGLPKSYADLTSSAALYACEWDIPTRAWEQGFPGLEDRFEWFAIRYSGAFQVSQAGSWNFRISSDDGARLYIDDKLVIDNDGVHGPKERAGKIDLAAGDHTMVLEYFQGPRYHINLQLFATPPGGSEGIFSVR